MSTKFFTNNGNNTLLNRFQGVFKNNLNIQFFDALVGYFRASGYFAIRPHLDNVPNIRILVGINVDKIVAKYQAQGLLFKGDQEMTLDDFKQSLKMDIQSSSYSKQVEDGIKQFISDVISRKVQIKAHPDKKLHAKIYIFRPENFNEYSSGEVITGSSNLTDAGLGNSKSSNYEFNVALRDFEDVKFATNEFEQLWAESIDILPEEIKKVKKETYINDNFTPFEVYIKFLIEYFGKSVDFDPTSISELPDNFKRLSYQVDAVEQGFELLKKHDGFFLADVVGLGKTVVGTLIAKKFFYFNDFPSHISKTLVVTPPALKQNWQETFESFDLKNYKIITNGSLHKIKNPEKFDLVIVDEAHKFRNDTSEAYNALQKLCKSPSSRKLKDGTKANKKVILISATPLNNRPLDIRNLVLLFQDGKRSTLEISNLVSFFNKKNEEYKLTQHLPIEQARKEVAIIYSSIREKVIKPLTIRRTRTDLKAHEEYKKDLENQDIIFPEIIPPKKLLYHLEPTLEKLYDESMLILSDEKKGLSYNRYQALKYLVPEKKRKYKNAELASNQLAFIMKTLLVKRIDSSFTAFKASLKRFLDATGAMVTMFQNGKIYIAPNLNVSEYIIEDREDELIDKISTLMVDDPTITICTPEDFLPEFFTGLERDYQILNDLVMSWEEVKEDPKFDSFLTELRNGILDASKNPQQKLVVFSESKETTNYLVKKLNQNNIEGIIEINSKNRKLKMPIVRANFDANLKVEEQKNDYKIILTTEVLAEGVNLHRSNTIVNYDTPWNSTRLMQRIGRVNRIGSVANKIYIYNFYPTAKVDSDIALRKKAITKLQAFHSALGEDSQIYSTEEEVETFGIFDKTTEESKDERLAYLMELRKFKKQNPKEFLRIKNMPLRARTGRENETLHGGTLTYVKNKKRDAFTFINRQGEMLEQTFVEAANKFKAYTNEDSTPLHEKHHNHINFAINEFLKQLEANKKSESSVDVTQSPQIAKALRFLSAYLNMEEVSEEQKEIILAAQDAIRIHKFNQLPKRVNQLFTAVKKTPVRIDIMITKLFSILNDFPLFKNQSSDTYTIKHSKKDNELPEIIISESFSL